MVNGSPAGYFRGNRRVSKGGLIFLHFSTEMEFWLAKVNMALASGSIQNIKSEEAIFSLTRDSLFINGFISFW